MRWLFFAWLGAVLELVGVRGWRADPMTGYRPEWLMPSDRE